MTGRARRWVRAGLAMLLAVITPAASLVAVAMIAAPAAVARNGCPAAKPGVLRTAPGKGKTVALTFDDGPGRSTAAIMKILAAHRVTATFFNLGANEKNGPATVRAEAEAGYAFGDHTWDHPSLDGLDAAGQAGQIDSERREHASITGARPCLLRPPYGAYDATTLQLAKRRGMAVWNWSVDTEDWKASGSADAYWVDRISSRAKAGRTERHPVILMHNQPAGNPATVAALPGIIDYYKAHGYTFVDLFGRQYVAPAEPFHYASTYLTAGQSLAAGQQLVASDRLMALRMQPDGNLELLHTGGAPTARYVIWQSHTRVAHSRLTVGASGDLAIISAAGRRVWHTGTAGSTASPRLTLEPTGNLVLSRPGKVLWQSRTARYRAAHTAAPVPFAPGRAVLTPGQSVGPGQRLVAANRLTELRMSAGGDLQLIRTGDGTKTYWVLWSSRTHSSGSRLLLRTNGNLVILSARGEPLWDSHTKGIGTAARLGVRSTGRAVLSAGGRTHWQSHTGYFIA